MDTKLNLKGDGAFDKAWTVTCNKHNHKHMFFRECPHCIRDAEETELVILYQKIASSDEKIRKELDTIMETMKEHVMSIKK